MRRVRVSLQAPTHKTENPIFFYKASLFLIIFEKNKIYASEIGLIWIKITLISQNLFP